MHVYVLLDRTTRIIRLDEQWWNHAVPLCFLECLFWLLLDTVLLSGPWFYDLTEIYNHNIWQVIDQTILFIYNMFLLFLINLEDNSKN